MDKICIEQVQRGDPDAFESLSQQYAPLIDSLADRYCRLAQSDDFEDWRQEARIGLYRAAMSFDVSQESVTFGLYAKICIKNRMYSLLRKVRRQSRNFSQKTAVDKVHHKNSVSFVCTDDLLPLAKSLLSDYEYTVLIRYLGGASYEDIAEEIGDGGSVKSVDNALYRAKKKIRSHLLPG